MSRDTSEKGEDMKNKIGVLLYIFGTLSMVYYIISVCFFSTENTHTIIRYILSILIVPAFIIGALLRSKHDKKDNQ